MLNNIRRLVSLCATLSLAATLVAAPDPTPAPPTLGEPVDLAVFGRPISETGLGVEWDTLREVSEVRVTGLPSGPTTQPAAAGLKLEWWGSVWPANGEGGWMQLDDPWNGKWITVNAKPSESSPGTVVFKLPPLTKAEWERAIDTAKYPERREPAYRRTLKIRVTGEALAGAGNARLAVFGGSTWRRGSFDVEVRSNHEGKLAGGIEVTNGILESVSSLPAPRSVDLRGNTFLTQTVAGGSGGVRVRLFYAENPNANSNDLTRVTVRLGCDPRSTGFSFVPQDALKDGGVIRVPDMGAVVAESSKGTTLANDPGAGTENWRRPVRTRLTEQPEMTRAKAMAGLPRLAPLREVPLGVPSARQEIFVDPVGNWALYGMSVNADRPAIFEAGREAKQIGFRSEVKTRLADIFRAVIDTREQPRFNGGGHDGVVRYLEEDHLPLIHVEWHTGLIKYHHQFATTVLLGGDYADDVGRRGDEPVVLLTKLTVSNTDSSPQPAFVNLRFSNSTPISLRDDGVVAINPPDPKKVPDGLTPLRALISMEKAAGGNAPGWVVKPADDPACSSIVAWRATLAPGETRNIYFKATFIDMLTPEEVERLKEISFEVETPKTLDYWRKRLANDMIIETPDPAVNDFYRANLWHTVITTDRDPKTGLYNQGVGTVRYRVYANETVMIARMMDMRGEHLEAERFIEPMLRYQGKEPLKGRFSTADGVFHSAGDYTHGEYAMNHGFVLWGIADHYMMTRDRAYLDRVAPQLVKGCEFLIRERASTMGPANAPRTAIHGLAPASSLEDVVEYQYWFATNAFFHLGLRKAGEALAVIDHPQARRILEEAEKYRQDLEAAVREAVTQTAVVRLRNGNYIPYVPSRVWQWRHLTEGWIREALYPSLHLASTNVLSPDDPLITWMLDEMEDNTFFSWQSGYNVADYERTWFEHGAITLQPCLVDTPTIYMARNEIQAALRSFWNTYALSIYPDVHCFAEWAKRFGEGGGPVYKTADEARWMMWLRQILVWEDADKLWFCRAMPREWMENGKTVRVRGAGTFFGPANIEVRSETDRHRILATIDVPTRNAPKEAWLRLRHPSGLLPKRVFINDRAVAEEQLAGEDVRLVPGNASATGTMKLVAEYQ